MSIVERALEKLNKDNRRQSVNRPTAAQISQPLAPSPIPARGEETAPQSAVHVDESVLRESGLLVLNGEYPGMDDEYRRIKRPLLASAFAEPDNKHSRNNLVVVTSPLPGAGKTFTVVNLAYSISLERDTKVLLVDADVAKPHISRAFGLEDRPGLTDLLVDPSLMLNEILVKTDMAGLVGDPSAPGF